MKSQTLTGAVVKLRNDLQPKFEGNIDPSIYDYEFFTGLESFAKKEREKAKVKIIEIAAKPDDFVGTLLRTDKYVVTKSVSNPSKVFNLEKFIDLLVEKHEIDKYKLRELATQAVVDGSTRTTYKVEETND